MTKTAEEFFRQKIKEMSPFQQCITLSGELITAETGMRWAHEYAEYVLGVAAEKATIQYDEVGSLEVSKESIINCLKE